MNVNIRSKYGSKKTTVDGIIFDSKKEATRYAELKMMERAGIVTMLVLQPEFILLDGFKTHKETIRPIKYRADFQYIQNNKLIVEDVKGVKTPEYKIKRKLFLSRYHQFHHLET